MTIDSRELRNCLGHFVTGVTVVTCRAYDSQAHGMTVNAFTAVSLEPPLVLVSIDRRTKGCELLESAPFAINVLNQQQRDVAMHFAGRPQAKLELEWVDGGVAPRLSGCLAALECEPWATYDGGDHVLVVGEVCHLEHSEGQPLLFFKGRFHELGEAYDLPWMESLDCPSVGWLGRLPGEPRGNGLTTKPASPRSGGDSGTP